MASHYPEEDDGTNWTPDNTVVLNVSNPTQLLANLQQASLNFIQNSNTGGNLGYTFYGQNSNTYMYTGMLKAGLSQSELDGALNELQQKSGTIAPGLYNNSNLSAYFGKYSQNAVFDLIQTSLSTRPAVHSFW